MDKSRAQHEAHDGNDADIVTDVRDASRFYMYWGKAGVGDTYHPLPYHSLDVAAVAAELLRRRPDIANLFAGVLAVDRALAVQWITFWIALHDLGKFVLSFQGLRPDLLQRLQHRTAAVGYTIRHDSLGAAFLNTFIRRHDALGIGAQALRHCGRLAPWVGAVTGHHGQPPKSVSSMTNQWEPVDQAAALAFTRAARALLLPDITRNQMLAAPRLGEPKLSWWLAGVTVLADWLGSNTDYFPYCQCVMPLAEYWARSRECARKAIAESGLLPRTPALPQRVATLFGWLQSAPERHPTPLQAWAETVDFAEGPHLFILEDVTGAGKTEAALELAQRLIAQGQADGLFIGLPTMATANAMYERVAPMASHVFDPSTPPSVVLAHGQRRLSRTFRDSVLAAPAPGPTAGADDDETASARCTAWLADSNKKALLADIGIGTIDQALLAIVHARHQSLRLLGLYRKVLIVDEVHACDAYMQMLLERLLQFHAASGGSAILLTATLPRHIKEKLAEAFFAGRGIPAPALDDAAYPLATSTSEHTHAQVHVSTRPEVCRDVAIEYRNTEVEVITAIKAALDTGRCVCWIRNTVADALAAFEALATTFPADAVSLFHARFAMGDRLDQERRILTRFGPGSGAANRRGQLVIATQVIEQSLDVDFDLVITDLAPIDRIIQRAGRLQRHGRDRVGNRIAGLDRRGGARLIVYGPTWAENPPANWYQAVFPRAAYVYNNPGELWLTARWLVRHDTFAMPGDARDMVESVFGDAPIPSTLQPGADSSWGKAWAARNLGAFNALAFDAGYVSQGIDDWARDDTAAMALTGTDEWGGAAAATRLGEPTVGVRLARWDGHTLKPWRTGDTINEAWEASSVRMPERLFDDCVPDDIPQATIENARKMMADHGRWSRLLVLSVASDDVGTGTSTGVDGKRNPWRYDRRHGLREASSVSASA